ncbi:uncharacterized protein LOC133892051 isoform X2 [Phragmites australis]|uniref:uncharacterized protein LOC133892051 isoform X2 n=1 Tax=Phragmites australis TaxID=29695 RepID=UPI002D7722EC|nr:uncharacterized protein LOC133892051 isoform X2 [Phragmites australis]
MTNRTAAGKQKKRLINYTNSEQYKPGKKTKIHSSNCLVSLKPHIGLKWDQNLRRVVPEKEQVGILWSDLAPFIESPKHSSGLADVTYVPPETFAFENLRGVLSYEVWATCLTEAERKFLIQFLPSETDAEESVHLLLTGKNHHFRNPFLSWSSSLSYGDIHPDAILNKEKHIRKDEKAYHIDLRNYHSNMIETLKKWRNRWLSCGDTDNLFSAKQKQGVMQVVASKGGMPLKVAQSVDVSKFMSYIEISRTQLNHIKRLKQSGDGIQTKHVSRVIGGLDKSHVKQYGALVEGEQRRMHEHWLNMARIDLPAAFEVLKDRKTLMEKSRKLLGLELGEKNVSILIKVDHSPRSKSQGGNDENTPLQDQDDEEAKYVETSIYHSDSPNVRDHNLMVVDGTDITSQGEQNSDVQDQDDKDIECVYEDMSCCANPDEQNEDVTDIKLRKDVLDVQYEEIREISYKDTTLNNHSSESQHIKSNYTSTLVHTLDCQNMQVQDLDGIAYTGPSMHAHEQDQDLKSISNPIMNIDGHGVNIPSEKSHPKNAVIADQEEAENITMIPSNSSSLLPKSSGEQILVEDFLDLNDQVAKGEKDRWQLPGSLQSYYHPPENRTYKGSGDLQIRQRYLSSGQQSSSYVDNGVLSQQLPQVTMSAFPVDNSASFIEPFSNQQSNGQLQIAKDIGMLSYSLQHANSIEQSTGLHSLANNRLAQSTPFPRPLQEQQLIYQSRPGLYVQQLHNNLYSGMRFPANGNAPIAEQHSYPAFAPKDHKYNWFSDGNQSHENNLSGLESDNCLTQALPSGSNTDGSLFSAISQYKRPSVHMQPGMLSPSQLLEPRNQVRPPQNFLPRSQDTNAPFSDVYGHSQNVPSSPRSHAAAVGSLNNMHWTNFVHQNPGMPDFTNRQFRGPWTR